MKFPPIFIRFWTLLALVGLQSHKSALAQKPIVPGENGQSAFVPRLKIELLDSKFVIGAKAGDAAHEARFKITATTGGVRAGDGTFGERMVGYRVPPPQILSGAKGVYGKGEPRVVMTQPVTNERGEAWGKVVSGVREVNVVLGYKGASEEENAEIESVWNQLGSEAWKNPRFFPLQQNTPFSYRMSIKRGTQNLPIRNHLMEFATTGAAGCLWRADFGPDLDGDKRPDGDYLYQNFVGSGEDEAPLAGRLSLDDEERFFRWTPQETRGQNGVYASQLFVRFDPRFVIDTVRFGVSDWDAYTYTGSLNISFSPTDLEPQALKLEAAPLAPAVWDRRTVARYLAEIEKPRRAALLKALYFGARKPHAFPTSQGWKLLETAAKNAKPQSRRWFLLLALKGFAGLRLENQAPAGLAAYRALFESAAQAPKNGAGHTVRQAVADFVNSVPIAFSQYELSDSKLATATTAGAWKAYSQSQSWPQNAAERAARPLWSLVWPHGGIPTKLVGEIVRQSKDWKNAPIEWRFEAASALDNNTQQKAALALWQSLKTDWGTNDLDRLSIVYDHLKNASSQNYEARRRNLAQEWTQRSGRGWAQRLDLAPDDSARERIVRQLLKRPRTAGKAKFWAPRIVCFAARSIWRLKPFKTRMTRVWCKPFCANFWPGQLPIPPTNGARDFP